MPDLIDDTVPEWVLKHPMYPEWQRICNSDSVVHPPWRASPELFIRDAMAELGKPPWLSEKDWTTTWAVPAEETTLD